MSSSGGLRLTSAPFLGVPIVVNVSHPSLSTWAYVTVSSPTKSRLSWEWLRDLDSKSIALPAVSPTHTGRDETVSIELYINGGYIQKGEKVGRLDVYLKNPLRELTARQNNGQIVVDVVLEHIFSSGKLRLATSDGGVRLATQNYRPNTRTHSLSMPRISGKYTVSFLSGSSGETALGSTEIVVQVAAQYQISFADAQGNTGALAIRPGASIIVCCGGPLMRDDAAYVVSAKNGVGLPAPLEYQTPLIRASFDAQGRARLSVTEEGIFHVILALAHEAGTVLAGSQALLMVTSLARMQTMTPVTFESHPRQVSNATAVQVEERVLCVVCKDSTIRVKLEPCRHVVLCNGCFTTLRLVVDRKPCPVCRSIVQGSEEVYIP